MNLLYKIYKLNLKKYFDFEIHGPVLNL